MILKLMCLSCVLCSYVPNGYPAPAAAPTPAPAIAMPPTSLPAPVTLTAPAMGMLSTAGAQVSSCTSFVLCRADLFLCAGSESSGAQHSAAPWLKDRSPASSAAAGSTAAAPAAGSSAASSAGAAAARPALSNGQRSGFCIRPQLPKSKQQAAKVMTAAAAPAYVQASTEQQSAPAGAAASGQGAKNWPPSLRAYVERAFAQCKTDEKRSRLQEALKSMISDAQAKGEMWTRSWDTMPLPNCVVDVPAAAAMPQSASAGTSAQFPMWQPAQRPFSYSSAAVGKDFRPTWRQDR